MNNLLETKLVEKFPKLCAQYKGHPLKTCFSFGFECEDGWYNLINEAFVNLNNVSLQFGEDIQIAQVKQKFGRLVIYIDGPFSTAAKRESLKILNDIYFKSENVSEISGEVGKIYSIKGWSQCLTEEEFKVRNENDYCRV